MTILCFLEHFLHHQWHFIGVLRCCYVRYCTKHNEKFTRTGRDHFLLCTQFFGKINSSHRDDQCPVVFIYSHHLSSPQQQQEVTTNILQQYMYYNQFPCNYYLILQCYIFKILSTENGARYGLEQYLYIFYAFMTYQIFLNYFQYFQATQFICKFFQIVANIQNNF